VREDEVERKEAPRVGLVGDLLDMIVGAAGLVEFPALAVDKDGIAAALEDRVAHPDAGVGEVPSGARIGALVVQLLVP
jgi:hypothetical protein